MRSRDYQFLGTTQSLCPACVIESPSESVVPAKIIQRGKRVYFRKHCPTHGLREDFVSGDAAWFDRHVGNSPGKVPLQMAIEPRLGCPFDCGLCTEHEQHTCLALLEITDGCNLKCPMCFASSAPGLHHRSLEDCCRAIDHLVAAEGEPEVLQLSGGEPTIHPQLMEIVEYACSQPIDVVMINTNGIRLARDRKLLEELAKHRKQVEIYLQFDGFDDAVYEELRGEPLLETKLKAIEACGEFGLNMTLVATLQSGVNFRSGENANGSFNEEVSGEAPLAKLIEFAASRPWIAGVSLQPASYVGRHFLPSELEQRVTLPDVIHAIDHETVGRWAESDFTPLPCAHPNGHAIAYGYRANGKVTPLARLMDVGEHIDLLSGRITYTRPRARQLIEEYLSRQCCGPGGCDSSGCGPVVGFGDTHGSDLVDLSFTKELPLAQGPSNLPRDPQLALIGQEFVERALAEQLDPSDMFRITITSFMDAYNFDIRQLMKSCVHFVLPSGHLIPFSAYNVFYREGHLPLPSLRSKEGDAASKTLLSR